MSVAPPHGGVQPVPGYLDRPVEHLLNRPSRPLDPPLRRAAPEVLGSLHDADLGIVHVGKRLGQEVAPHREIRIQDDQVFRASPGEGVAQVAGLLARGPVRAVDVAEAEELGHRAGVLGRSVVEDVGSRLARVFLHQIKDGLPGIAEQFNRLTADGQVDIYVRVGIRVPRLDARLVSIEVEAGSGEIYRQADRLIDEVRGGEEQER
jgi:hypothetical protein